MPAQSSSASSDYGSELDYADADFDAQLDAAERAPDVERVGHVEIALEGEGDNAPAVRDEAGGTSAAGLLADGLGADGVLLARESLWERFRKWRGWGALSVSDLSGPSWCEWQHSYRLLTKPHLPPLQRPATITTASGAILTVDTARTVKREQVLDRGREVHAKIEREVMGPVEEVKVEVQGKEEWWALRILNTAACLETLLETGRVREVPVVGWVGDFLVFGVCDEIERRSVPQLDPPSTNVTASASSNGNGPAASPAPPATPKKEEQRTLEQFFTPVASPSQRSKGKGRADDVLDLTGAGEEAHMREEPIGPRWTFVLSDTKTRFNRSIPSEAESRPARLQLMLYHRLIVSLLRPYDPSSSSSGPPPFSWPRLYDHHALSPSAPLSPAFLSSIAPILVSVPAFSEARTLEEFVSVLGRYGELLGDEGWLANEMEISYRLREDDGGRGKRWKGRRTARKRAREDGGAQGNKRREEEPDAARAAREADEEEDLRRAIELSLREASLSDDSTPMEVAPAVDLPLTSAEVDEPEPIDSQLEDSQLPFLANPSLPLPLPAPTSLEDAHPFDAGSSAVDAFALPLNSQSDTPVAPAPAGRYNLRRRPTAPAANPPPRAATSPRVLPPATPATPPRPASAASSATLEQPHSRSSSPEPEPADPAFIGTSTFPNSPAELNAWLSSAMAYWRSERAPVGVAPSEVSRCRTCEFEEGCEWRAEKAREALELARRKREEKAAAAQGRKGGL